MIKTENAAIACTISELFEQYDCESFSQTCEDYITNVCMKPVEDLNKDSWKDCFLFLKEQIENCDWLRDYYALFEYRMPDSEKRADVVLLAKQTVVIFEFKMKARVERDDVYQVGGYLQAIRNGHYETGCRGMCATAFLTLTKNPDGRTADYGVEVLTPASFRPGIEAKLRAQLPMTRVEADRWVASPYYPLPNMVDAAVDLFEKGELPNIKSIKEGDIAACSNTIKQIIDSNKDKKNIIFVTGVPGSGKTLVGLKAVYDRNHADHDRQTVPLFVTGNDYLINILQDALGETLIKSVKILKRNSAVLRNTLIVFDEAQRAWDAVHGETTEPDLILRRCDSIAEKFEEMNLICLIGEGQSINRFEERGMSIWADALVKHAGWDVFLPASLENDFSDVKNVHVESSLYLDTSIRTDFINIAPFIESLLNCDFRMAREQYGELFGQGFKICVFRKAITLSKIKAKHPNPKEHMGLLASSYSDAILGANKKAIYVEYDGTERNVSKAAKWYKTDSRKFKKAGSEFLVQGIDLEWPIVVFSGDYYLRDGRWTISPSEKIKGRFSEIKDKDQIMQNVYRVLLTRACRGLYLYVPEDPVLNETYETLQAILQTDFDNDQKPK